MTFALLYRLLVVLLLEAPLIDAIVIAPSVLYLCSNGYFKIERKNTLYFFIGM